MRTDGAHSQTDAPREAGLQQPPQADVAFIDRSAWTKLARPVDEAEYLSGWLTLQCRAVPRVKSGVLILGEPDGGQFAPAAFFPERTQPSQLVSQVANAVIQKRQGVAFRDPDAPGLASRVAVAYPFLFDDRLHGLVAVEVLRADDVELQILMRQLQWGASWIEGFVRRRQSSADRLAIDQLRIVLDAAAISLEQDRACGAALAATTQLADRLHCNRVTFGCRHRRQTRIIAMSHAAHFADRSSTVAALTAAIDEALDQQTTVVSPMVDPNALWLDRAHRALARLDPIAPAQVITVPVTDHDAGVGAFVFEFAEPAPEQARRLDVVRSAAGLIGPTLLRAYADERPLPAKAAAVWRRQLGRDRRRSMLGRLAAAAAVLAGILFLSAFKIVFAVPGDARLEGLVQRTVAAPFGGFLAEALVRPGDRVEVGAVLATLDQRDVELEKHAWMMRREQHVKEQQRVLSEHKLAAARVLDAQIAEAGAQIKLLEQKLVRSVLRAPFAAVVIDGDHSQAIGRSVQQGEPMFTLAPLDSYRIVIEVDERDIAYVGVGQRGRLVLTAMPSTEFSFTVTKVSPVTNAAKGRNAFRVEAALETGASVLRPGLEGVARIETDRQLAVWIWTRRLVEWVRLQLWALWP